MLNTSSLADPTFTGMPGCVGQGIVTPVPYAGQVVTSTIESIGSLVNPCRAALKHGTIQGGHEPVIIVD